MWQLLAKFEWVKLASNCAVIKNRCDLWREQNCPLLHKQACCHPLTVDMIQSSFSKIHLLKKCKNNCHMFSTLEVTKSVLTPSSDCRHLEAVCLLFKAGTNKAVIFSHLHQAAQLKWQWQSNSSIKIEIIRISQKDHLLIDMDKCHMFVKRSKIQRLRLLSTTHPTKCQIRSKTTLTQWPCMHAVIYDDACRATV